MASPTDILVTGGSISESAGPGALVATLSAVDADNGDTFTYALTDMPASALFEIVGDTIRLKEGAVLDFETTPTYNLTVQVTDSTTNTYSEVITIQVTDANEITGTSGDDRNATQIDGTIGDDIIDALAGNDTVLGDAGSDTIYGQEGADVLYGGFGDDTIYGGTENDNIYGESGADNLYGEDGDDYIDSGGGGGTIDGGDGNDTIRASNSTSSSQPFETLIGGAGNDTIYSVGNNRADTVDAGSGSDTIFLRKNSSSGDTATVTLGADSDTIRFGSSSVDGFYAANAASYGPQAIITDFAAGAGGDIISIGDFLGNLTGYSGTNPFGSGYLRLVQDGTDTLLQVDRDGSTNGANYATVLILQNTTATAFTADNFDPAWPTDGSNPPGQTITGTSGDDRNATQIDGTLGDDIIDALAGNDVVRGDSGSDTIYGQEGADVLYGGFGDDTIYGGTENDNIYGESGADNLYGEDGDDYIDSGGGGGTIDGGDGNDTIRASNSTSSSQPFETLIGGAGNDTIYSVGNNRADTVDAGSGSDTIFLRKNSSSGDTATVTLGADSDTIRFGSSSVDGFYAANAASYGPQAIITDFAAGAGGDIISIGDFLGNLTGYSGTNPFGSGYLRLVQDGTDTLLQVDRDGSTNGANYATVLILQNTTATAFTADNFDPAWPTDGSNPPGQTITGTSGDDRNATQIDGTLGDDIIDALAGNDVVRGDSGSDTIYGREGADGLYGGFGDDTIYGGTENDNIYGESGADNLYGEDGDDYIDSGGGGGTIDGGDGNDTIRASNSTSSSQPFETLIGGAGNDTIYSVGNNRADTVDAGSGSDTIFLRKNSSSGDTATVTLGADSDTIRFGSSSVDGFYAANAASYGPQAIITDFAAGAGGDIISIGDFLGNLTGYSGTNPFGSGYLRLVQDGTDTLLQVDRDGSTNGANYATVLILQNTTATAFTADNFDPAFPPTINVAPEATITPTSFAATEQTSLDLKNTGLSVGDPDGDNLTVTISVGEGTLTVTAGTSDAGVSGSGSASVILTGAIAQINALLNTDPTSTIAYFNSSDAPGASTTLTLQVNDGGNTATDTATIDIAPVNDDPTGAPTATLAGATEDVAFIVNASDLLQGFSDPEGDTLSVANLTSSSGSVVDNMDGTFTVTPAQNFNGTLTLSYDVSDGNGGSLTGQTRTVSVAPVNDDPTGAPTATLAGATEDVAFTVNASDLLQGFSDPEGDTLSVANLTSSSGSVVDNMDGTFTVTPATNFNGTLTLTYDVSDGNGGSLAGQTRTVAVAPVNDEPTGAPTAILPGATEDVAFTVNASDLLQGFSDPEGDTLSVANLTSSSGSVVDNMDGTFTVTPAQNFNGTLTLTYDVSDGNGGSLTGQTRTVAVAPVNDDPTGAPTATLAGASEDVAFTVNASDLLQGFSDPEGDTLSVANLTSSSGSVVDNMDGTFTVTPATNFNGTLTLTYDVSDGNGGSLAGQTRTVAVAPVNDDPTGAPTATLAGATEDVAFTVNASDLLQGFSDPEGDTLSVTNLTSSSGSVVDNMDGTFTVTPATNFNGTLTLTYDVSDGSGGSLTGQTRTVSVAPVNDDPTGAPTATLAGATEDVAFTVNASDLLQGFSDPEGDTLSVANLTSSSGSVVDNTDGTFTVTPATNFNGTLTLTYDVSDGNGGSLTGQTRTVSVAPVNDDPTGTPMATLAGATEDVAFIVNASDLLQGFSDPEGDTLSVANLTSSSGSVVDNMDGTFTVTPAQNFNGTLTLSYDVSDGNGGSLTGQTRTVSVAPVNDPPQLVLPASASVDENAAVGTVVAQLNATDVDPSMTFTYLLTDDANGRFAISGSELIVADSASLDYESQTSHQVTISVTDDGGLSAVQSLLIDVNDLVEDVQVGTDDPETLVGTDGDETFFGGGGDDIVAGGDGDDIVRGGEGNDRLLGEEGNDLLIGGSGNDILRDGDGDDRLLGGIGDDLMSGGLGNDVLRGGTGNDRIFGGPGNDLLDGGGGNDVVRGDAGADRVYGGSGNDRLFGGTGNDRIFGGNGRDTIFDERGNDRIDGGAQFDTVRFFGSRDDYTIANGQSGVVIVTDTVGNDGRNVLVNVERIVFNDDIVLL